MTTKSIRISEETYAKLLRLAGRLQARERRSISIEDAIKHLLSRRVSDLAGLWEMSKEEADDMTKFMSDVWKNW